jgi:hypothetical protein
MSALEAAIQPGLAINGCFRGKAAVQIGELALD